MHLRYPSSPPGAGHTEGHAPGNMTEIFRVKGQLKQYVEENLERVEGRGHVCLGESSDLLSTFVATVSLLSGMVRVPVRLGRSGSVA